MREFGSRNANIYASEKLYILEKVDKEDHIYYPNDDITFTIICINNSEEKLDNILIRDILPKEVIPINDDSFIIEVSKGDVSQRGNIVEVKIDVIGAKEAVKIIIKGKVSE